MKTPYEGARIFIDALENKGIRSDEERCAGALVNKGSLYRWTRRFVEGGAFSRVRVGIET